MLVLLGIIICYELCYNIIYYLPLNLASEGILIMVNQYLSQISGPIVSIKTDILQDSAFLTNCTAHCKKPSRKDSKKNRNKYKRASMKLGLEEVVYYIDQICKRASFLLEL